MRELRVVEFMDNWTLVNLSQYLMTFCTRILLLALPPYQPNAAMSARLSRQTTLAKPFRRQGQSSTAAVVQFVLKKWRAMYAVQNPRHFRAVFLSVSMGGGGEM